jgi:hypothetical protein
MGPHRGDNAVRALIYCDHATANRLPPLFLVQLTALNPSHRSPLIIAAGEMQASICIMLLHFGHTHQETCQFVTARFRFMK